MRNIVLLSLSLACLAGCNAVNGLGEDMKQGGQAIQNAVDPKSNEQQQIDNQQQYNQQQNY